MAGILDFIDQKLGTQLGLLMSDPRAAIEQMNQQAGAYNQASLLATQAERNALRGLPVTPEQAAAKQYVDKSLEDVAMGFAGTVIPSKDIANQIFYRGSRADEKMLRPSSGHEHGVIGISTTLDKDFARTHGDYVKSYKAKLGEFVDFFDLVKMYNKKYGEDAFSNAAEKDVTDFAKSKGYIGSYYNDPFGGADYRFFDASSLIPINKVKK